MLKALSQSIVVGGRESKINFSFLIGEASDTVQNCSGVFEFVRRVCELKYARTILDSIHRTVYHRSSLSQVNPCETIGFADKNAANIDIFRVRNI